MRRPSGSSTRCVCSRTCWEMAGSLSYFVLICQQMCHAQRVQRVWQGLVSALVSVRVDKPPLLKFADLFYLPHIRRAISILIF